MREAVKRYSPSIIYFDGEWEFPLDSFEMQGFLAWLYNESACADGTIPMLQQERLVQMGDWLKVNGEAIYGTRRWITAHEGPMVESVNPRLDSNWKWTETKQRPMVHYTSMGEAVYAICLAWPGSTLKLEHPSTTPHTQVRLLGCSEPLKWKAAEKGLVIEVPAMSVSQIPCRNAWVFKLTGLKGNR